MKPPRSEEGRRLGLTRADEDDAIKAVRERLLARMVRPNRETAFLAGVIVTMLVLGVLYEWLMGRLGFSPPDFIKSVVIGALIGGPAAWIMRWYMQAGFYAELAKRGHNICPACGYLREGIAADAPCPECGNPRPRPAGPPPPALP
jgi:hypothetical protein